ncbi:hypothetical protein BVY04_04540 [bacterium M21]|nr:hypothetical protein BVY04_04540 [bacterium M21]
MDSLVSFEQYLRDNHLIDGKYVSYYTNWVREFVAFCHGKMANLNWENMSRYLARLENVCEEWQVRQASDALVIYTGNYLKAVHGIDILARSPDRHVPEESGGQAWLDVDHLIRDAIGLRRLSASTEKTYTGWNRRFGHFLEYKAPATVESTDVKNYPRYNGFGGG